MKGKTHYFYKQLAEHVQQLGGMFNAHLHLDRAGTLEDAYLASSGHDALGASHISLHEKHYLINYLHSSRAYESENLQQRINACLDTMVDCNTIRADSLVDVTDDEVQDRALRVMQGIKEQRQHEINLQIGAYSPLGFTDQAPNRWRVFEEGAKQADFIAALPEADDVDDYPDNIGFEEHCIRMLDLAKRKQCMLHVHTDQRNEARERGTERLLEVLAKEKMTVDHDKEPQIWAVHVISPSTYDEKRFQALIEHLLEHNVGVICCPSAAVGMRQLRTFNTPTYNSIPRVLEMAAAGVPIRLASDNIADICSPTTTADLIDEVFMLSAALRFYDARILAKFACGKPLSNDDKLQIKEHLTENAMEIRKTVDHYQG